MKMKLPIDTNTLKSAAKVAAYVGAGAALAQAGSALAKRGIQQVADFAAGSATNEAIVDSVAGVVLGAAGLAVYGAVTTPAKAKAAAPFVIGGALVSAWAPVIAPEVAKGVDQLVGMILPGSSPSPGGYYRERFPGGGGYDVPMLPHGGGFDIPVARPGGTNHDVPVYMPLH